MPVEVGTRAFTEKTVDMVEDCGLCRYNIARPPVMPKGMAIVGRRARRSVLAEVVV